MSDYGDSIDISEFLYKRPVYYTSPYPEYESSVVAKLILNSENFNFDFANSDGSDFRLTDDRGGFGVLKMWTAYWSQTDEHAIIFFKIPNVDIGVTYTLQAYWGNSTASDASDPASMDFLFYEEFSGSPISASKWSGEIDAGYSSSYGYLFPDLSYFTTTTNPLQDKTSWIIEAGLYANFPSSGWDSNDRAVGFNVRGPENNFIINIMHVNRIEYNIVDGTQQFSTATYRGLEPSSYQELYIDYYEPEDRVTYKMQNRDTYDDTVKTIYRKVEGDTRPTNVRLYGRQESGATSGAKPTYINWFIVREYDGISLGSLDASELYIEYENYEHQLIDHREYLPDLTSVLYQHESSFGGNPYLLSDEGFDSDTNVWISDIDATAESEVALTIHTGWAEDTTDKGFTHYDSSRVYYYNASKLSDNNNDRMGRDFWHCTTASGWAAIKFPTSRVIGAFRIKATDNLNACPKNFIFYGTNYNPYVFFEEAYKITEGTFEQTEEWQSRVLTSEAIYKYYVLDVLDTYGGEDIEIQEWEMMAYLGQTVKRVPAQLRLHPALYDDWETNFPFEFSFLGSLDGVNWTTLISWTRTVTPFYEHVGGYGYWQRYSFNNVNGYWSFRLLVRGNWGASDTKIIIGEWSIHELAEEVYTHRVLDGTSNDIQQIWAADGSGIDDELAIIFVSNEKLNRVAKGKLLNSDDLPSYYEDFNVA